MDEPSILDYIKSRLTPWKGQPLEIPTVEPVSPDQGDEPKTPVEKPPTRISYHVPWKFFLTLSLAIIAQSLLEPPKPMVTAAVLLYGLATLAFFWTIFSNRDFIQSIQPATTGPISLSVREIPFGAGLILLILAFLLFAGNRFNILNLFTWLAGLGYLLNGLWLSKPGELPWYQKLRKGIQQPGWRINISRWSLLILLVFSLLAFFRFYRLSQVPGEMFSDHAEKLLDVSDLLNGQTKIFFERNTGREAIQFYLTAAIATLLGTGLSFISLKLGTALAGYVALPFIYKLGKELGGRWVGLLALIMAGTAYWPNVISRIGLRFPLYPLFVAPAFYYLFRGLRTSNRNDFLLAGLAVGLGLHGYSPARMLPLVVVAVVAIYLLHKPARGQRLQVTWALVLLALVAFAVFIPLFRYALSNPEMFSSRALSRLSGTERALPGPVLMVFLKNFWSAMIMFFWNNGNIWVHSVVNRPAMTVISAALFFLGLILVFLRYIRYRNWADLAMLVSIPLLMMPSIMSLAFPEENPSLNRTGGAVIPVFIITAIALEAILHAVKNSMGPRWGLPTAAVLAVTLLFWSSAQDYDLVFRQFDNQFKQGAWNTSQIGTVIRGFSDSVGTPDSAYVVPYPYWVDTRLVGINAGYPTKDYALSPDNFPETVQNQSTKLFILKPEDQPDLDKLVNLYPQGVLSRYASGMEGKDFLIYLVPGLIGNKP